MTRRERAFRAAFDEGAYYPTLTLRQHVVALWARPRQYVAYARWRFGTWTVLPGDRFYDMTRMLDYRVLTVKNGYVVAERTSREARYRGLPPEDVRVARPLPPQWWPA